MTQTVESVTSMVIMDDANRILFFLRTFLTLVGILAQMKNSPCPPKCKCEYVEGRYTTDCSNVGLTQVPVVPRGTMVLKMDGNTLDELKARYYLLNRNLTNVAVLSLQNCQIKQFRVRAFWGLSNLLKLTLARNEIAKIPVERRGNDMVGPFVDMINLQALDLSHNKLTTLTTESLGGLKGLEEIDLSHNNISLITGDFSSLVRLRRIYIQSNKLKRINVETFFKLASLNVLNLIDNPYVCDCSIRKFVKWQQNKYFTEPPTCDQPLKLHDKRWDQIKLEEFACPPRLEPRDNAPLAVRPGDSVTFVCVVTGDPRPEVEWKFHNKTGYVNVIHTATPKYTFSSYINLLKENISTHNLTIRSADVGDIGLYQCIATNFADKDDIIFKLDLIMPNVIIEHRTEVATTLTTPKVKESSDGSGGGGVVVMGIVLGATVSVLTALLLIIVCYRHMERERHMSPVQTVQNGYGYHIIDTERTVKFTDVPNTPVSTRTTTTFMRSPNNIETHLETCHNNQDLNLNLNSCPPNAVDGIGSTFSSDLLHHAQKCARKESQPKRVLRFAEEDQFFNDDDLGYREPSEQDSFTIPVRETEI